MDNFLQAVSVLPSTVACTEATPASPSSLVLSSTKVQRVPSGGGNVGDADDVTVTSRLGAEAVIPKFGVAPLMGKEEELEAVRGYFSEDNILYFGVLGIYS